MREAGCFFNHEFTRIVCFSTNIIAALPLGLGATHRDISTRIFKDLESCLNRHIQASKNGGFEPRIMRIVLCEDLSEN
jgi:hypothetical protein